MDLIGREGSEDNLDLVAHILGEKWAQRPIGEAADENGFLGWPSLAPEKAAGDTPGGV